MPFLVLSIEILSISQLLVLFYYIKVWYGLIWIIVVLCGYLIKGWY